MSNTLIIPDGKVSGCLPRRSLAGQWCPLAADRITVSPQEEWAERIAETVGMRPHVHHIFDQDGVGSCARESTTGAVQIVLSLQGEPFRLLNPWSGYCRTSGGRDRGSGIDENLRDASTVGTLPMDIWPRSKGWQAKPTDELMREQGRRYLIDEWFDVTSINEVGSCLLMDIPVVFGWEGHSCVLVELLDQYRAVFVNSWDETWGDNGFGVIRLSEIDWRYGAFGVRSIVDPGTLALASAA